jgi:molybdenum cofactor cytidylyltransferase
VADQNGPFLKQFTFVSVSSLDFRAFAVIPAAGRSVRMGRPKLLLPWRGSTLIESLLAAWKRSRVEAIVVVVHPDDGRLAELCRQAGAEVIMPELPPSEMKVSVAHALRRIAAGYEPADDDVWLLAPADMPLLRGELIDRVLAAYQPRQPSIIVPKCGARHGHPVLFPWALARQVEMLPEDEGLNALRRQNPAQVIEIEDPSVLVDIVTPEQYSQMFP